MSAPKPSKEFRTRLIDLEEATWRALQQSGSAMIPFITKDCIMQFPMGMKLTATSDPSVSDVLHSSAFVPWKSFELMDIDVTPVGPVGEETGGVVSYRVEAIRRAADAGGADAPGGRGERGREVEFVGTPKGIPYLSFWLILPLVTQDALCCSVWRWDGEKFALAFHQQYGIPLHLSTLLRWGTLTDL